MGGKKARVLTLWQSDVMHSMETYPKEMYIHGALSGVNLPGRDGTGSSQRGPTGESIHFLAGR